MPNIFLKILLFILIAMPISSFASNDVGANLRNNFTDGSYLEATGPADGYPNSNVIKGWPAKRISPGAHTTMQVWLNRDLKMNNNAWAVYNVYNKKGEYIMTVTFRVNRGGGEIAIEKDKKVETYSCYSNTCNVGE